MSDEALPTYKETLQQMRHGLDFCQSELSTKPTIGWQIDPFGSSAATVSILYKLGYEALIENRVSNDFKIKMHHEYGFNFNWEGHQVTKTKSQSSLLGHILQYFYIIPTIRLDYQFIVQNLENYKDSFFD